MINMQKLVDELFSTPQDARHYLGASAIGNPCVRAVQYYWLQILGRYPKDKVKDFPPRVKRIFDRGHVYEAKMREWMEQIGFIFEQDDSKLQFQAFDGKFRGHVDGVITSGPSGIEYPCLWENKCLGGNPFLKVKERGIKLDKPVYYSQVETYMHYLGLERCLFTCICADTMSIYTETINLDPEYMELLKLKVAMVFDKTEENKLLPKVGDKYHCKYCDYSIVCDN